LAISADSYGSVAEVLAYTRHLITGGDATYTPLTRPTLAEVERFIDRRSAKINGVLAANGYAVPVTGPAAAIAMLAEIAVMGAAGDCELTQRHSGSRPEGESDREYEFLQAYDRGLAALAGPEFAALGAAQARPSSAIAGLSFGGRTAGGGALRPVFGRTSFGNDPTVESPTTEPDAA